MRFPYLCTDNLFAVRERLRCLSRTTALLFVNDNVALRERQINPSNETRENAL